MSLSTKLWSDLKTDEERSAWLLLGRGCETGVVAPALQNDIAMAYHRLALLGAASVAQDEREALADLRAAVAFLDQVQSAPDSEKPIGVLRDAREWLERAARAALSAATPPADEARNQIELLDAQNHALREQVKSLQREAATWNAALTSVAARMDKLRRGHPRLEVRYWTGQWWEPLTGVKLDECLDALRPIDTTPPAVSADARDARRAAVSRLLADKGIYMRNEFVFALIDAAMGTQPADKENGNGG